ncbi:MAG: hypothetical protein ABIH78_05030 [Candidatus Peregrinibacteria bacterium]
MRIEDLKPTGSDFEARSEGPSDSVSDCRKGVRGRLGRLLASVAGFATLMGCEVTSADNDQDNAPDDTEWRQTASDVKGAVDECFSPEFGNVDIAYDSQAINIFRSSPPGIATTLTIRVSGPDGMEKEHYIHRVPANKSIDIKQPWKAVPGDRVEVLDPADRGYIFDVTSNKIPDMPDMP